MLSVDQPDVLEKGNEVIKVAMNVPYGDHGFRLVGGCFGFSRPCLARQRQEDENENTSAVCGRTDRRTEHFPAPIADPGRICTKASSRSGKSPYGR
jgi:hypothetical protein